MKHFHLIYAICFIQRATLWAFIEFDWLSATLSNASSSMNFNSTRRTFLYLHLFSIILHVIWHNKFINLHFSSRSLVDSARDLRKFLGQNKQKKNDNYIRNDLVTGSSKLFLSAVRYIRNESVPSSFFFF